MAVILDDLVFFSVLGIIAIFLLKLYNVLTRCDLYDRAMSIVLVALGFIVYFFIEIGLFLNLTIEFNIMMQLSRILMLLIFILWIVEILIYAALSVGEAGDLTRMQKRRYLRSKRL